MFRKEEKARVWRHDISVTQECVEEVCFKIQDYRRHMVLEFWKASMVKVMTHDYMGIMFQC